MSESTLSSLSGTKILVTGVKLADCVHRGRWLDCRRGPAPCPALPERGEGLMGSVIESRSTCIPIDLVGVAQLPVSGNSSCRLMLSLYTVKKG
jgi:hypothetical protein